MTWNYRIIMHDKSKPKYFAVHEIYYDEKGNIESWTADPINITGDSKQEILKTLKHMIEDTKHSILQESELEKNLTKASKNW